MTPLLWQGYRDPFEIKDLGIMHEKDTCRAQYDQFYFIYRSFEVSFIFTQKQKQLFDCFAFAIQLNML